MNERETMIATASFAAGWDAALDEARGAVEGVQRWHEFSWGLDDDQHGEYINAEEALAAIDALKEKP